MLVKPFWSLKRNMCNEKKENQNILFPKRGKLFLVLMLGTILFNCIDTFVTFYSVYLENIAIEINPLMNMLMSANIEYFLFYKLFGVNLCIYLVWKGRYFFYPISLWVFLFLFGLYFVLVAYQFCILLLFD